MKEQVEGEQVVKEQVVKKQVEGEQVVKEQVEEGGPQVSF